MQNLLARRRATRAALVVVLLAGTAIGGIAVGRAETSTPIKVASAQMLPDFSRLAASVRPAVVSITNHLKVQNASVETIPTPFGMFQIPQQQQRAQEAKGSGFLVDANGTIVTNNHVVKNAREVMVTLSDGQHLKAKVIGTDPRTDLAVLRVNAGKPLPYLQLGQSNNVVPGQWVVAMGNPYGLGGTVTAGIVSARGRDIGAGPYDDFIQIDAPINPGNSGGPLFNQQGQVIGVDTAIISPSGGSVGIGFAIPSDMVKNVVAQIEAHGSVTRGYLGVSAQPVTPEMATALGLPSGVTNGALVATVEPNSPAQRAGLQPGDVIRDVNGQTIKSARDLAIDIAAIQPGTKTPIQFIRKGETRTLTIALATLPNGRTASASPHHAQGRIGLALAPLTPNTRNQLGLPHGTMGAVVAGVQPGSPADQAGLQQGDVITAVGAQAIDSPQAAVRVLHEAENAGKPVALRVLRNGHAAYVALDPAAKAG
ncbi:MAG: Do family serine endopeptidase [Rhodospirillales bacterium]|nr:Do family serine endopeptidase [Rhodospirillales bacterium]